MDEWSDGWMDGWAGEWVNGSLGSRVFQQLPKRQKGEDTSTCEFCKYIHIYLYTYILYIEACIARGCLRLTLDPLQVIVADFLSGCFNILDCFAIAQ